MTMYPLLSRIFALAICTGQVACADISSIGDISSVTVESYAIAKAAARDNTLAKHYKARQFEPMWIGATNTPRLAALLDAFDTAPQHGLPALSYQNATLRSQLQSAQTPEDIASLDVQISKLFLKYAQDMSSGVLTPKNIVPEIVRTIDTPTATDLFAQLDATNPRDFFRSLAPKSTEYNQLMRHKLTLERTIAQGGWGPAVPQGKYKLGDRGNKIIGLRNRLVNMGYLNATASPDFNAALQVALQKFQQDHGLSVDGTAGAQTLKALNVPATDRLQSVIVAMERERWLPQALGTRHIWVNLTDFHARVVDNGHVSFETRSVIGARKEDRQSPEFSDTMEFMVINPTWYVPRSITTKEYLPKMQSNSNAVKHLEVTTSGGRVVPRDSIDFKAYTAKTFPYSMRQPPSKRNALGLVKFMFPNKYNIYLHDTPKKSLFGQNVRAFSHGCVRLNDPFDFAYHLLAQQTQDPEGYFKTRLKSGNETTVPLATPVPVHLVYRTAFSNAKGKLQFRGDIYDRDKKLWKALEQEGVRLSKPQI